MKKDEHIGDKYHEMTDYHRGRIWGGARPSRRPDQYKTYDKAERKEILEPEKDDDLARALEGRRSRRSFTGEAVSFADLSALTWAAQGVTGKAGPAALRTSPSAGALYPIETYLVANNVDELEAGVYHLNVREQALERVRAGDHSENIKKAALDQGMCARAAAVFCLTAIPDRIKWKYAQRAYRYIYMEAGHIVQNVCLAAQQREIGCCAIGAFYDDELDALLGVDGESETSVYICAVGPVKEEF